MQKKINHSKWLIIVSSCCLSIWMTVSAIAQSSPVTEKLISELRFRCIGPAVTGGRIHDVEALPQDPSTIYVATASGGIWKSINKGTTWKPIFDNQPVSTFGDLDIAPSDPKIIWAGTGEQNNRQSTSWGNGVYLSTDGGETWSHKGLAETHHVGRICVHPHNPDLAYVGALGNLWKPTKERGVFKTTDRGKTWKKVLYIDKYTGAVDMVMDPSDPNTLYAAMYQRLRRTWGFNGGGPGSGIYKTTNGGESWEELSHGIPEGDKGRIGITIARTNGKVLYATIEHAEESGTYRTQDGGETWTKVNNLNSRPMYYSKIFSDPVDENRVYVISTEVHMTEDGGRTFRQLPTRATYDVGVHSDHHTLWIDPTNPKHFYLAGDAGLHETWDRGETYNRLNNFSIGQFYAIGLDMRDPYYVYGGMQDNHSWVGPSATHRYIGIINDDWKQIGFGDGMYQQPDPTSHRYVYSNSQNGNLTRIDGETGDMLAIRPVPIEGEKPYRFDWVTPSLISRHDPNTIYFGGNHLFISRDRGVSWERTEDLTRQIDRASLDLMGIDGSESMLSKHDGTSSYGEIITIAESPMDPHILWVGTDDGNVQVTMDGGKRWVNVSENIKGVPQATYVSRVVASARGIGTAYVSFDAHRDGDWAPYVFKTDNFGVSWKKMVQGLPEDGSVNVIIEHPDNPDLLFLGTEHALFLSTTAGEEWIAFESNLPTTLYDDLKIHPREKDLVVGTHGRSIWILDDSAPLAEWSDYVAKSSLHIFSIRPATLFHYWKSTSYRGQGAYAGENPPFGALIHYYVGRPVDAVEVIIQNSAGEVIRKLKDSGKEGIIHRTVWDLRHSPPPYQDEIRETEGIIPAEHILPELPRPTDPVGPFVSPGIYTVIIKTGEAMVSQTVQVRGDPQMNIPIDQWRYRERFLLSVSHLQSQAWTVEQKMGAMDRVFSSCLDSLKSMDNVLQEKLERIKTKSDTIKVRLRSLRGIRSQIYRLAAAYNGQGVRQGSLYPPTQTHVHLKMQLQKRLELERQGLEEVEDWVKTSELKF